jgi:hypothetical protein
MIRRLSALVALVALVASACGSSTPALTDPSDIVAQSVNAVQGLKSLHLHLALSGSIKIDMLGTGKPLPVDLQGTTVDGDIDLVNGKVKGSLNAQALFLSGDLVYVGGDVYVRASLLGPKYQKFSLGSLIGMIPGASAAPGGASAAPSVAIPSVDPSAVIKSIRDGLAKLKVPPVKGADEKIGDQDCYKVTIKLTQDDVAAAGASLPPVASGTTFSATVDVWVRKNDLRPAQISAAIDAGDSGKVTLTATLSNIDAPVVIDAPPADQVQTTP